VENLGLVAQLLQKTKEIERLEILNVNGNDKKVNAEIKVRIGEEEVLKYKIYIKIN